MFEVQKLPPKEGISNRTARFVLQAVDKILYPDSDKVIAGGPNTNYAPKTRKEMNDIAREHDLRRFNGWNIEAVIGGDNLHEVYKAGAKGELHFIEPIKSNGDWRVTR